MRARVRSIRPDTWAIAALVAVVLVANLPYLVDYTDPNPLGPRSGLAVEQGGPVVGANTLDPTDGYITQALGHLAATDILHGHLPFWNPYEGAGMPLLGEGQSAALFPGTLLLALDNGQFWEDLLLELVAGVATFFVLRRVGVSRRAAVASGCAFALNGSFAWLATTAFNPVALLPVLVLGVEFAYSATLTRRRGGWWLIAVALALSVYAGFPETTYIDGLLVIAWFVWRALGAGRTHLRTFVIKCASGVGAGLLLAMPFLVAFIGALPHEFVGFHNGNAADITMPPFAFPQLLLPYVYGPMGAFSDAGGHLGAIWGYAGGFVLLSLLFLAVVSLGGARRRGLKVILAAFVVILGMKIYGEPPGIERMIQVLPGATSVAFYRYSFPAITFALAVMAALGLDELGVRMGRRRALVSATAGMLLLVGLLAFDSQRLFRHVGHLHWAWASIAWAVGIVTSLGLAGLWRGRGRGWVLSAIVIADAGLMFGLHELSAPRTVRTDMAPVAFLQRHLGLGRFFTFGQIAANYGAYWRIASLNDIDLPLPKAWTKYVNASLDPYVDPVFFVGNDGGGRSPSAPTPMQELVAHLPAYRNAGVSYVVTSPAQTLPTGTFRPVLRSSSATIYRVPGAAPYLQSTANACAIGARGLSAAAVTCPRPTLLLRRELVFPGWSASVDGHGTPIHAADGIYQSVLVPAGRHTVTFDYAPPGFGWAAAAFFLGLGWVVVGVVRQRRQPVPVAA